MSNRIRQFRQRRGLTLQQLAERVGSDKSQITRLERGERRLTTEWLERLAGALGCNPADLLSSHHALPAITSSLYHTVRGFVFDALQKTGWSLPQLAAATDIAPERLSRLLYAFAPPPQTAVHLTDTELWRIAEAAEVAPLEALSSPPFEAAGGLAEDPAAFLPPPPEGEPNLPVQGPFAQGREGQTPQAFIARPFNLFGVNGAYALFMQGEAMRPRFAPGELLHINPARPPQPGNDVVLKLHGQPATVRRLEALTAATVITQTLNPPQSQTHTRTDVEFIHTVVGCTLVG